MRQGIAEAAKPALFATLVMSLVGALAVLVGQPWLFPSLGPTLFLLATNPAERPRNVFAGHAIGAVMGFGALFVFGAQGTPSAFDAGAVDASRAAATALAVGMTLLLQSLIDAKHPPAAATTMLITLGGMRPVWSTIAAIVAGVGLIAGLGYATRGLFRARREKPLARLEAKKGQDIEAGGRERQGRDKLSEALALPQNGRDGVDAAGVDQITS
ncbi:HPP family protein [Methylocystis sp. JAN1]|uniref:HPP family protein n=1 Tax=Methylocystis sp. JAN1 TaxID=3397211 RepID=UPI003FA1E49B